MVVLGRSSCTCTCLAITNVSEKLNTSRLSSSKKLNVVKAVLTNLLEDELEPLETLRSDDSDETILQLNLRAFEVVTVKVVVESPTASER